MKGGRPRKARKGPWCENRSRHEGKRVMHLFTSRRRVGTGPWVRICSWCETPKPNQKETSP